MSFVHLCSVNPQGLKSGARPMTRAARKMAKTAPSSRVSAIMAMEMLPRYLALL